MVFLITGLQARTVISRIGHYPLSQLAISVAVITVVVIVARFVWIFPATYLPRWLFPAIRRKDPSPPWQWPFLLAFTGVRGIVSLAAALAIPFATSTGQPFPYRDLILFLTFSVILITLVGQGLMLPWVIRKLGLFHAGRQEREIDRAEEYKARSEAVEAAIERLDHLAAERNLSPDVIEAARAQLRDRLKHTANQSDGDDAMARHGELHDEVERLLIAAERTRINDLFRSGELKDEARRRIERELDLRENHLSNQRSQA
jgi:monovalent cation/hydrogen antiporter